MLVKIPRQDAIERFPSLPLRQYNFKNEDYDYKYPRIYANYDLTLPSKSYKGRVKSLAVEVVFLTTQLGFDQLVFLGDEDIPWLFRLGKYPTFDESLGYLADNKIGKRFNGALQVRLLELPIFIKHLASLVRTNGILPFVHFIDPGHNIIASICQDGHLHLSTANKKADMLVQTIIAKSNFEYA